MISIENRSFTTRFGERCFCGKSWGDPAPCGDSRADWTIRDGLRLLFADKVDNCVVCDKQVQQGRKYCFDCGLNVQKYRNRQDRHARMSGTCILCGGTFEKRKDKRQQKYCSLSCANRGRSRGKSTSNKEEAGSHEVTPQHSNGSSIHQRGERQDESGALSVGRTD